MLNPRAKAAAIGLKAIGLGAGILGVGLALGYAYDELGHLASSPALGVGDVVAVLAIVSLALAGTALIAQLPESLRARFRRLPRVPRRSPVYGFGTLLAVGVGATLGSPLFILIPLNVEQYELVSLLSLALAMVFSVAMARVYSDFGKESKQIGAELVGTPSFARVVSGASSVRYFVSRVSMWIANTALAAYSQIVFIVFDFVFMPRILAQYGFNQMASMALTWGIAVAFAGWTLVNIFLGQRFLRRLGQIQILLTGLLIVFVVDHALALGSSSAWNLGGLLAVPGGAAWVPALIINTGYLYLLFFGFQEIQVLERDAVERSPIPVISWIKRGYTMGKTGYFEMAMIGSVLVASAVNILYGTAVFSASHGLSLQASCAVSSCIPALYLAEYALGGGQVVLIAAAFLIATVTTFVPAFLAAARHLGALGEDGYMPASLAGLSWVFTIVAIFLLAIGGQNFLVEITDVMVLISLGIIALSGLSPRRGGRKVLVSKAMALLVGLGCFLFGGAVYFAPGGGSVVVFGSIAVLFAYVIFDIIELGTLGAQIFLSAFGFVSLFAVVVFNPSLYASSTLIALTRLAGTGPLGLLLWSLLATSFLLATNVIVDVKVLHRTSMGKASLRPRIPD
jgi:amino acid transporter